MNKDGQTVAFSQQDSESLILSDPFLWFPRYMNRANNSYGYMYTLKVNFFNFFCFNLFFILNLTSFTRPTLFAILYQPFPGMILIRLTLVFE